MNGYLLDACALIALLNDEPGAQRIEAILSGDAHVFMSAINTLKLPMMPCAAARTMTRQP